MANALAQYGIAVATIGHVVHALPTVRVRSPGATPDQLMCLVGDRARGGVWVGTRDELATELNTAFLINEPVGMLINIGRIRQDLSGRVGDAR